MTYVINNVGIASPEQMALGFDAMPTVRMQTPLGVKIASGAAALEGSDLWYQGEADAKLAFGRLDVEQEQLADVIESPAGTRLYIAHPDTVEAKLKESGALLFETNGSEEPDLALAMMSLLSQLSGRYYNERGNKTSGFKPGSLGRITTALANAADDKLTHVLYTRRPDTGAITSTLTFVELPTPEPAVMIEDVSVDESQRGSKGHREFDALVAGVVRFAQENDIPAIALTTEPATRAGAAAVWASKDFAMTNLGVYAPKPSA